MNVMDKKLRLGRTNPVCRVQKAYECKYELKMAPNTCLLKVRDTMAAANSASRKEPAPVAFPLGIARWLLCTFKYCIMGAKMTPDVQGRKGLPERIEGRQRRAGDETSATDGSSYVNMKTEFRFQIAKVHLPCGP